MCTCARIWSFTYLYIKKDYTIFEIGENKTYLTSLGVLMWHSQTSSNNTMALKLGFI